MTEFLPADKRQHLLVCFGLMWILRILHQCRQLQIPQSSLSFPWKSMIFVLCVGSAKEAADAVSSNWPWCSPTCEADGWDMVANIAGAVVGGLSIFLMELLLSMTVDLWMSQRCKQV